MSGFFPLRILIGQIKYNLISLFYWALLFGIVTGSFGRSFGIPYLFLSPEYLGKIGPLSFFLLGFGIGGFTMAFHTYSYIKLGPRFPFLATVARPFIKFCVNNSLLPILFCSVYLIEMIRFQKIEEIVSTASIVYYALAFLLGFFVFIIISLLYFFPTTYEKDNDESNNVDDNPIQSVLQQNVKWYNYFRQEKERTYYYIGKNLKIYPSRSTRHLDKETIEHVFAKNRINASLFEILTICAFVLIGQLATSAYFEIPAAMSVVLLLTILHMLFSALMSWFHRWTYPLLFAALMIMNYLSLHSPLLRYTNYAYGLNYDTQRVKYNITEIRKRAKESKTSDPSLSQAYKTLSYWKEKQHTTQPKLVILTTSGGGSRSALWTYHVLSKTDQLLAGKLTGQLHLITGASGGMVGAAFFREILLHSKQGLIKNRFDTLFYQQLGKDLLNKLLFSASTNDLFFRYKQFTYNGREYTQDRGLAFEQQLHENTGFIMDHNLGYYKQFEGKAIIPQILFSPTIINDGRRLLMGTQSYQFMCDEATTNQSSDFLYENIDYQSYFKQNDANKIRFSSVLRASATFPFILPMVAMPTSPEIQLMDAGIRDNFGTKATFQYILALHDWIEKNTSGVVIVEVRDTKRVLNKENYHRITLFDKLLLPFGNVFSNFPRTQDFDQEQLIQTAKKNTRFPIDIVTFNLREKQSDRIALSWHLSKQEKIKISQAFYSYENQRALKRLKFLLK